jgi:uncharacterized Tic20 family protein
MLYSILQHAHSGFRWIVLILLVWAAYTAFTKWKGEVSFTDDDGKRGLFTMLAAHIQLLVGFVLYFMSPYVKFTGETMKDSLLRFYTVEHISLMLIAIVLITLGHMRAKRGRDDAAKFKSQAVYFSIALVLILISIPWPFREGLGGSWF